jgi:hypothetical protein
MNTHPEWQPRIITECPEESMAVSHLHLHIIMLASHERYFLASVRLLEHVEDLMAVADFAHHDVRLIADWGMLAAHHAAITITNFRDTIAAIKHAAHQIPSIRNQIDSKSLHSMVEKFGAEFPDYKETRDGFAHSADKMFSPEKIAKNIGDNGAFEHSNLTGRRLTYTIDGKRAALDVTGESLAKLTALKRDVYEAFRKATSQ